MNLSIALLVCAAATAAAQAPEPANCYRYCQRTFCCEGPPHAGRCPAVVDGCEFVPKSPPLKCETDLECDDEDKCCMDGCLNKRVCKTAILGPSQPIVHPGRCPRRRPTCPPWAKRGLGTKDDQPRYCQDDGNCSLRDKCCEDSCLTGRVCKTAIRRPALAAP